MLRGMSAVVVPITTVDFMLPSCVAYGVGPTIFEVQSLQVEAQKLLSSEESQSPAPDV